MYSRCSQLTLTFGFLKFQADLWTRHAIRPWIVPVLLTRVPVPSSSISLGLLDVPSLYSYVWTATCPTELSELNLVINYLVRCLTVPVFFKVLLFRLNCSPLTSVICFLFTCITSHICEWIRTLSINFQSVGLDTSIRKSMYYSELFRFSHHSVFNIFPPLLICLFSANIRGLKRFP